jgi:hypothetical protein
LSFLNIFKCKSSNSLNAITDVAYTHDNKLHNSNICQCIYARYAIAYIWSKICYCIYMQQDMLLHIYNVFYCIQYIILHICKILSCIYTRYAIAYMQDILLHIWKKCNCISSIHAIAYIQNTHWHSCKIHFYMIPIAYFVCMQ